MTLITHKYRHSRMALLFPVLLFSTMTPAKISPIAELQQTSQYGRVHTWNQAFPKPHSINVNVPHNAPIIISDYHSPIGANGLRRNGKHHGVDIFATTGTPVIAAADGRVIRAKIDKCWGPTVLISHGLDKNNRRFYALYGHMRNINVAVGQHVKRGQQIAEMGNDIFTTCGAGLHHLHFQVSYDPRKIPLLGWGWANFVRDGAAAPNPHKYWENGEGEITCFEKDKNYSKSGLTYPLPCTNTDKKTSSEALFVQHDKNTLKRDIMLSLEKASAAPALEQAQSTDENLDPNGLENNFFSSLEEKLAMEILAE